MTGLCAFCASGRDCLRAAGTFRVPVLPVLPAFRRNEGVFTIDDGTRSMPATLSPPHEIRLFFGQMRA
jgi:hypothetical protein